MTSSSPVIIGGGAAGLMAGLFAARAGARPVLLEGAKSCGVKIVISGGGRCNLLPTECDDSDFYTSGSRNVLRRLFRTWRLGAVRSFFEDDVGIPLVEEEETGKLFPAAQSAKLVRDRLVAAVQNAGGIIHTAWRVTGLEVRESGGFRVLGTEGATLDADRVVIATGGKSLPKTGSDGAGYGYVRRLGHTLVDTYPALVPLTSPDEELCSLTGIALPVRWRAIVGDKVREERERALLFTHRGFSGPAMLDASHWFAREGGGIQVSWGARTPDEWKRIWKADPRKRMTSLLSESLPRRLGEILVRRARIPPTVRYASLTGVQIDRLLALLCEFRLPIDGQEGYRKAEVTGGGVPLGEVNPSTLESRVVPGLFLCGEIFDVIGRIGGYNFLWAWVTGRLAGEAVSR